MKIVVLDGYGLNPGDLSWEEMRALGNVGHALGTEIIKLGIWC